MIFFKIYYLYVFLIFRLLKSKNIVKNYMKPVKNYKTQNEQICNKRRIEQSMELRDWNQMIVDTKRKCNLIDEKSTQQSSSSQLRKLSDWLSQFENMPESTQFDALNAIVPMCKQSQIRYLHTLITPYFQVDFMRCLPKELSLKILGYLAPKDLVLAASVSQIWRHLAEDNVLWAKKCQQYAIKEFFPPNLGQRDNWERFCPGALVPMYDSDWPIPDSLRPSTNQSSSQILLQSPSESPSPSVNSLQIRQQIPSSSNKLPSLPLPECLERSRFKAIYLRNERISNNWRRGRRNAKCYLRGHDEHVITCLKLRANRIVTGSDDCTLRVWSVSTGQCTQILSGHTGGVWALQLSADGQIAISGSTDRTVRVWNTESGEQIHCLNGHTSTVRCMSLRDKILVTGSRDCTIRMWDIDAGRPIRQFIGHLAAVRCVKFDGETLVSGAYDHKIHVWNGAEGTLSHVLEGHTNRVYSIHFVSDRNLVISGSLDTTIRVWNVKTGECLQTLIGHQSLTSGMKLHDNLLVSANADSTIKVWNILDGTCMYTLAGPNKHASAVTGLRFLENGLVATSGDDGIVKLWDITEGTFVCDLVKLPSSGAGGCVWRMKTTPTLLVCAVGSRNGTEDTKMILMDFDAPYP